jgi:hypothetical protein
VRVTGGCFYHKQPGRLNPAAREALGAEAFETAQVERAALSVEQAIAEAMEEDHEESHPYEALDSSAMPVRNAKRRGAG